jgi:hypothetical protein
MLHNVRNASLEDKSLHQIQSAKQKNGDCGKAFCRAIGSITLVALAALAILATCLLIPSGVAAFFISFAIFLLAADGFRAMTAERTIVAINTTQAHRPPLGTNHHVSRV